MNSMLITAALMAGSLNPLKAQSSEYKILPAHVQALGTVPDEELPQEIANLNYMELEDPFDLGFDTTAYLPEDFNPDEAWVNLGDFVYIPLDEEPVVVNQELLPKSFDAYAPPKDILSVSYIDPDESEEPLEPSVDLQEYLPSEFDPFERELVTLAKTVNDQVVISKENRKELTR